MREPRARAAAKWICDPVEIPLRRPIFRGPVTIQRTEQVAPRRYD
jgi:hypothetical protein